jgi:hypothetical protein
MLDHLQPEEISMLLIPRPEVELRGEIMIFNVSTTTTLQVARIPYILNDFSGILSGSHLLTVA